MEKYVIKQVGNVTEISVGDSGKFVLYEICPGILFAFNEVNDRSLPEMSQEKDDCICTINYAVYGTCGLYSSNGKYIYLRAGELMISSERAARAFEYPVGSYTGVEIYIMRNALENREMLQQFNIDIDQLLHICLSETDKTVIVENVDLFKNSINDIISLYERKILDLNLLRLHTFYILRLLTAGAAEIHSGYEGALTKSQVNMAKQAENRLSSNLMNRETIASIAAEMGISATSLKNYFRAVYEQNISDYLKEKRIEEAKKLLAETTLSVLDIANRVGFESQSKFTAMFHAATGLTPTEFRRSSNVG